MVYRDDEDNMRVFRVPIPEPVSMYAVVAFALATYLIMMGIDGESAGTGEIWLGVAGFVWPMLYGLLYDLLDRFAGDEVDEEGEPPGGQLEPTQRHVLEGGEDGGRPS